MNSIRKLMAVGTGAVALCGVAAFALAPVTVLAEGSHHWALWQGAALNAKSVKPSAATLSPACSNAVQAIKTAFADDRSEDAAEKSGAALAGANPAADVEEDKTERAALKALWVTARDACAPQVATATTSAAPTASAPTAACLAATQAAKDAWARKDYAALKSLWSTLKAACGFPSTGGFAFEDR
jgi:hypothetical protein